MKLPGHPLPLSRQMSERDKIVVFHSFSDPIEANIIKAKLDAHGVPCFLSEENLATLTPFLSNGVRLHIFEADRDEVMRIVLKSKPEGDDDLAICPFCKSKRIITFSETGLNPATVVKIMLQLSKRHYCLDCEAEFDR
jgi:hypothetical protein